MELTSKSPAHPVKLPAKTNAAAAFPTSRVKFAKWSMAVCIPTTDRPAQEKKGLGHPPERLFPHGILGP